MSLKVCYNLYKSVRKLAYKTEWSYLTVLCHCFKNSTWTIVANLDKIILKIWLSLRSVNGQYGWEWSAGQWFTATTVTTTTMPLPPPLLLLWYVLCLVKYHLLQNFFSRKNQYHIFYKITRLNSEIYCIIFHFRIFETWDCTPSLFPDVSYVGYF